MNCKKDVLDKYDGGVLGLKFEQGIGIQEYFEDLSQKENYNRDCCCIYVKINYPLSTLNSQLYNAFSQFGKNIGMNLKIPHIRMEDKNKGSVVASIINNFKNIVRENEISKKIMLVMCIENMSTNELSLVSQFIPNSGEIEENAYIVVATSLESLNIEVDEIVKWSKDNFAFGNYINKTLVKEVLGYNLKARLTYGDIALQKAKAIVKNDLLNLQLLNMILHFKDCSMTIDSISKDDNLMQLLLELIEKSYDKQDYDKCINILTVLAIFNQPMQITTLLDLIGITNCDNALSIAELLDPIVTIVERDDVTYINIPDYRVCKFLIENNQLYVRGFVERLLKFTCNFEMLQDLSPQLISTCFDFSYDIVKHFGNDESISYIKSNKYILQSGITLDKITNFKDKFNNVEVISILSGRIFYLALLKKYNLLAQAYINRERYHETTGNFNDAVYDYTAAITSLCTIFKYDVNNELQIIKLFVSRGDIYDKFSHYDSAIKDYSKAINRYCNLIEEINSFDEDYLILLYLKRATTGKNSNIKKYAFDDYNRIINLLTGKTHNNKDKILVLCKAHIGRGLIRNSQINIKTNNIATEMLNSIDDFKKAIECAMSIAQSEATSNIDLEFEELKAVAFGSIGNNFYKLAQYIDAVKNYSYSIAIRDRLLKINKLHSINSLAKVYINRGTAYSNLTRYNDAMNDYAKAVNLRLQYATNSDQSSIFELSKAYLDRGILRGRLKDFVGEIDDYTKAIDKLTPFEKGHNTAILSLLQKLYQYRSEAYKSTQNYQMQQDDRSNQLRIGVLLANG